MKNTREPSQVRRVPTTAARSKSGREPRNVTVAEPMPEESTTAGHGLPLDAATEFGTPLSEITQIGAADFAGRFSAETPLLVVDPSDLATVEVVPMLAALNVETVVASTHGEGRAALENGNHPLVILVLDKPAPGTRALALAAQQHQPPIPLVVCMPPDSKPLPRNLLEAGVTSVVPMGTLSPPQWRVHLHALLPNITPGTTTDQTSILDSTLAMAAVAQGTQAGQPAPRGSVPQEVAAALARARASEREAEQTKEALRLKSEELRDALAQLAALHEKNRELNASLQATATVADNAERAGELVKAALREKVEELMGTRADLNGLRGEHRTLLEEVEKLRNDNRELELAASHAQEQATTMAITIEELEEAGRTAKEKLAALQKAQADHKTTATAVTAELAELKKTAERKDRELETARAEQARLTADNTRITGELARAREERAAVETQRQQVQANLEEAQRAMAGLQRDQTRERVEAAAQTQRLSETQARLDEVTARLKQLESTDAAQHAAALQAALDAARAETATVRAENGAGLEELQRMRAELETRDAQLRAAEAEKAQLATRLQEQRTTLEGLQVRLDQATLESDRSRSEARALVGDAQGRLAAAQQEAQTLAARVKDLEDKLLRYAKDIFLKEEGKTPEMEAMRARLAELEKKLQEADTRATLTRTELDHRDAALRDAEERLRAASESTGWLQSQLQDATSQIQQLGQQLQVANGWEKQAHEATHAATGLDAQLRQQYARAEEAMARVEQLRNELKTRVGVPQEAMPVILELATRNGVQLPAVDLALQLLNSMVEKRPDLAPHVRTLTQLRLKLQQLQQRFS